MGRLIDADALIEEIARIGDLRKLSTATVGKAITAVPTIDAVPVVRCRDCKYSDIFFPDSTEAVMPLKCLNIRYGGRIS